jgi:hypothetical protein
VPGVADRQVLTDGERVVAATLGEQDGAVFQRGRPDERALGDGFLEALAERVAVVTLGGELGVRGGACREGVRTVDAGEAQGFLAGADRARPLPDALDLDGRVRAPCNDVLKF